MDLGTLRDTQDWPRIQQRYEAWWQGEVVDRALIAISAPRYAIPDEEVPEEQLRDYWTNPERVLLRLERELAATYRCGDAFPKIAPVQTTMVAILAAYLGCPLQFVNTRTTWLKHIIGDWSARPKLAFDPDNEWWQVTKHLLEEGAKRAVGNYRIVVPDLNGPGEIAARLRGTKELGLDMIDDPEAVLEAMPEINQAWFRYFQACHGIVHQYVAGYVNWCGQWSELPATDLQCDFSIMISREMFECMFLPFIEEQTELVERTIYHLDGPGATRHLDALLDLPRLSAIQWVPGAGAPPVSAWLPLLRRVQARGKCLQLSVEPWEVSILLSELQPEGLSLTTTCATPAEADALLLEATRLSVRRSWLVS
jgi:hypothetical protein